jgi:hypothetical protein
MEKEKTTHSIDNIWINPEYIKKKVLTSMAYMYCSFAAFSMLKILQ